jgi:signal transduction histidine kinase
MKPSRLVPLVQLLLLAYVVAALLFWGISLNRQSHIIYQTEKEGLIEHIDSLKQPEEFARRWAAIEAKRETRTRQYLGEGGTFLLVILIGAAVVYSSYRRSLRLSRQQNNFILAVTHELKSPIAGIKLNLQTLERRELERTQQQQLLNRSINEANRLNDLCNNMLVVSQLEGRHYKRTSEKIDFSDLVDETLQDYAARYPGRMSGELEEGIYLQGDKLLLQMGISNLLENAIKYSPSNTPVKVSLLQKPDGGIRLSVMDEGIGIPDTEKQLVFKKFYRVGAESTRKTKGTGLGLYLTQHIVRQMRGKILVRDNMPQGTEFVIEL